MTGRRSPSLWVRCCPGNIYNTSPPPPPPPACPAPRPPCPPPPWLMTCNLGTNSETQKPQPRPRPRSARSLRSRNPCSRSTASRLQPRGSPSWMTLLRMMRRLVSGTRSCPCWTTASSPATPTTGQPSTGQTGSAPEPVHTPSQQSSRLTVTSPVISNRIYKRRESEWSSSGLLLALNALFNVYILWNVIKTFANYTNAFWTSLWFLQPRAVLVICAG